MLDDQNSLDKLQLSGVFIFIYRLARNNTGKALHWHEFYLPVDSNS